MNGQEQRQYLESAPAASFALPAAVLFSPVYLIGLSASRLYQAATGSAALPDAALAGIGVLLFGAIGAGILYARQFLTTLDAGFVSFLYHTMRNTGLRALDRRAALVSSGAALVGCVLGWPAWTPVLLACAAAFWGSQVHTAEPWPVAEATPYEEAEEEEAVTTAADADFIPLDFQWQLQRGVGITTQVQNHVSLTVDMGRYQQLQAENPSSAVPPSDVQALINHLITVGTTPEVYHLAVEMARIARNHHPRLSAVEGIANVLSFVQRCIDADEDTTRWKYPLETLHDRSANARSRAILAAALLRALHEDVIVLYRAEHCAVGVAVPQGFPSGNFYSFGGKRYYYCEVTDAGWHLGELPTGFDLSGFQPYTVLHWSEEAPALMGYAQPAVPEQVVAPEPGPTEPVEDVAPEAAGDEMLVDPAQPEKQHAPPGGLPVSAADSHRPLEPSEEEDQPTGGSDAGGT
jgi:hypothetical protein